MLKPYDYLFYRMVLFFKFFSDGTPYFLAMMALCWVFFFNFMTALALLITFYPEAVNWFNKIIGAMVGVLIIFIHSVYFFYDKKWQKIDNEFSEENDKQKKMRTVGVLFYIMISIIICFFWSVQKIADIINK